MIILSGVGLMDCWQRCVFGPQKRNKGGVDSTDKGGRDGRMEALRKQRICKLR